MSGIPLIFRWRQTPGPERIHRRPILLSGVPAVLPRPLGGRGQLADPTMAHRALLVAAISAVLFGSAAGSFYPADHWSYVSPPNSATPQQASPKFPSLPPWLACNSITIQSPLYSIRCYPKFVSWAFLSGIRRNQPPLRSFHADLRGTKGRGGISSREYCALSCSFHDVAASSFGHRCVA